MSEKGHIKSKIGQLCGHKNGVFGGQKFLSDIKYWSGEPREFFETINPFLKKKFNFQDEKFIS